MARKHLHSIPAVDVEGDPFPSPINDHGGPVDMRDIRALREAFREELEPIVATLEAQSKSLVVIEADLNNIKETLNSILRHLEIQ